MGETLPHYRHGDDALPLILRCLQPGALLTMRTEVQGGKHIGGNVMITAEMVVAARNGDVVV